LLRLLVEKTMTIWGPVTRTLAILLLALAIIPASVILAWFTCVVHVYPSYTAVVFRFGHPHREVGVGWGLRFPAPVEQVRYVATSLLHVTEADLRPRDEAPTGKVHVHWQVKSATDFLLNAAQPHDHVKAAVESASRDTKFYLGLHGPMPGCDLIANAQALLNEQKRGIDLRLVCIGVTGRQCVAWFTCVRQ
jgi:hypothetical protein